MLSKLCRTLKHEIFDLMYFLKSHLRPLDRILLFHKYIFGVTFFKQGLHEHPSSMEITVNKISVKGYSASLLSEVACYMLQNTQKIEPRLHSLY